VGAVAPVVAGAAAGAGAVSAIVKENTQSSDSDLNSRSEWHARADESELRRKLGVRYDRVWEMERSYRV
jgi:hypothetical protein